MAQVTTDPVRLPPRPPVPKVLQGLGFLTDRHRAMAVLARRYGSAFALDLPIFGKTVVVSDPALVKDVYTADTQLLGPAGPLGDVFGPGSTFSLDGDAHRRRRKLLVPPFHGKRMHRYEQTIEEEVLCETAGWLEGEEFETLQPMMRITLNAILRAVFGADGAALDELRDTLPREVAVGARLAVLPQVVRRDFGPWKPSRRTQRFRQRYDEIIAALVADALADPALAERTDVLSLLAQARYPDGSRITDQHLADELLTLLAAGHETTATTLSWCIERLTRHPRLLTRLTEEADAGESVLRQATIWEVQRTRPVIDFTVRRTRKRLRLGDWVVPERWTIMTSISAAHASDRNYPDANVFQPDRFVGNSPDTYTWIPYGGGVRRCVGSAFANMEMDVTLRTLLREFEFATTYEPGEQVHSRGVANAPRDGGKAVVYRRSKARTTPAFAEATSA